MRPSRSYALSLLEELNNRVIVTGELVLEGREYDKGRLYRILYWDPRTQRFTPWTEPLRLGVIVRVLEFAVKLARHINENPIPDSIEYGV